MKRKRKRMFVPREPETSYLSIGETMGVSRADAGHRRAHDPASDSGRHETAPDPDDWNLPD